MNKHLKIIGITLVILAFILNGCVEIPDDADQYLEIENYEFVYSTEVYSDGNNFYTHNATEGYKLLVVYIKISNPINSSKDIDPNRDNIELFIDITNHSNLNHRDEGSTGKLSPGSSRSNIRLVFEIQEQEIPDKLIYEDKSSETIGIAYFN